MTSLHCLILTHCEFEFDSPAIDEEVEECYLILNGFFNCCIENMSYFGIAKVKNFLSFFITVYFDPSFLQYC